MSEKLKFHQLDIGEVFRIKGCQAVKLAPTRYRFLGGPNIGASRGTTGTANVNQPSGDQKRAEVMRTQRQRLDAIAKVAGFETWYRLEQAVLNGEHVAIGDPAI